MSNRSNYKEYLDNIVYYKDIDHTFDKVEIAASDIQASYVKVIAKGFYNDFLDKFGDVRVLSTCDYNDTWTTSIMLLDDKSIKGQIIDFAKLFSNIEKEIKAQIRHKQKQKIKKQKQAERRAKKK